MDVVDIELFIEEIKKYPEIWNVAAEEYHDRNKKRAAWINICRVFASNFDDMGERDKNETCNTLVKKWRNIKDNFMRNVKKKSKSGQAAETGKKYIYARQLSFLLQASASTSTQSSLDVDGEQGEEVDEDDPIPGPSSAADVPVGAGSTRQKKRKRDLESALVDFIQTPITIPPTPEPNADRAFFESLLPSIGTFSEDEKLELRSEVMAIVRRMRQRNQNNTARDVPYLHPNLRADYSHSTPASTSHAPIHSPYHVQQTYQLSPSQSSSSGSHLEPDHDIYMQL